MLWRGCRAQQASWHRTIALRPWAPRSLAQSNTRHSNPRELSSRAVQSPSCPPRTHSALLLPHEFCTHSKVRAYEVDQYGVVNNAVYVQYLQHGRHELLESEGLEHHQEIPAYALSELTLKYKRPLRSQDAFLITVATAATGRAKVEFEQRIIRLDGGTPDNDAVVMIARATVVLLTEAYKPLRMPDVFRDAVCKYMPALPE